MRIKLDLNQYFEMILSEKDWMIKQLQKDNERLRDEIYMIKNVKAQIAVAEMMEEE